MNEQSKKMILFLKKNSEVLELIRSEYLKIENKYLENFSLEELKRDNEELFELQFHLLDLIINEILNLKINESYHHIRDEIDSFIREGIPNLKIKCR